MTVRIKVVPDAEPNAEGDWLVLDLNPPHTLSWLEAGVYVARHIPEGHHMVAYRLDVDYALDDLDRKLAELRRTSGR